jgi:hypothetical protein
MTFSETAEGKPAAAQSPVNSECIDSVVRAARLVAATAMAAVGKSKHRREDDLVKSNKKNEQLFHRGGDE